MVKKVESSIRKYDLICKNDRILVAVSGGPDSVCLLYILVGLKDKYSLSFHIAHLNHSFRGKESQRDATFVRNLAKRIGIPSTIEKMNVSKIIKERKLSKEDGAREIRYEFLERVAEEQNCNKIALGHTADDQAETVLLRLFKGTGRTGICGIPPKRGKIIRPLIEIRREDVLQYLNKNKIPWLMDSSNLEKNYLRNFIRLDIIPTLKKRVNPKLIDAISKFVVLSRIDESYLDMEADELYTDAIIEKKRSEIVLKIDSILSSHTAISTRMVRKAIKDFKGDLRKVTAKHIESILRLCRGETGKKVSLPFHIIAEKSYDRLTLSKIGESVKGYKGVVEIPGVCVIDGLKIFTAVQKKFKKQWKNKNDFEAYFDLDEISPPLYVRNKLPGDKFIPLGMKGEKKVKDIFIDDKVPKDERNKPLLIDKKGILWIIGNRRSERAKLKKGTEKVLYMKAEGL